jgi:hypothetical protein
MITELKNLTRIYLLATSLLSAVALFPVLLNRQVISWIRLLIHNLKRELTIKREVIYDHGSHSHSNLMMTDISALQAHAHVQGWEQEQEMLISSFDAPPAYILIYALDYLTQILQATQKHDLLLSSKYVNADDLILHSLYN